MDCLVANNMQTRRKNDPENSEAHFHRRKTDGETVIQLHARVDDHEEKIAAILSAQQEMTENIRQLTTNMGRIADVLEMWNNAKGFWATIKMISTGVKIIIPLIAFTGLLWGGFRFLVWLAGT